VHPPLMSQATKRFVVRPVSTLVRHPRSLPHPLSLRGRRASADLRSRHCRLDEYRKRRDPALRRALIGHVCAITRRYLACDKAASGFRARSDRLSMGRVGTTYSDP
jgi:hypothetical protein